MIDDQSRVAESRRIATLFAEREGLPPQAVANAAIVASEAASNLWKHAQKGEIHIATLSGRGEPGIEILSIDRGPGIGNLNQCFVDGHSTLGTAGTGLGAIRRLSDEFDITSQVGQGTVLLSQIYAKPSKNGNGFTVGLADRPLASEVVSGDSWAVRFGEDSALMMVADGLGHGLLAADASAAAVDTFLTSKEQSPKDLVHAIHLALRGTRGAAVAVASVELGPARVRFAGLGNIAGMVVSPAKSYSLVSHNGTAGFEAPNVKEFEYPWTQDAFIVMHSDGLSASWDAAAFAKLRHHHASVISALLYRQAGRDRDDACVIVGKRP
jgi:anti-sigma regulatory factor (Ser/Thr protein kinase)